MVRRRSNLPEDGPYPVVTEKPSSTAPRWNHRQLMAPGGLLFAPDLRRACSATTEFFVGGVL